MSSEDSRSRIGALHRFFQDAHDDPAAFIAHILRECADAAHAESAAILHVLDKEAFVAFSGDPSLLGLRVDLPLKPAALGLRHGVQRDFVAANRHWIFFLGARGPGVPFVDPHVRDESVGLLTLLLERVYEGEARGARTDELTGLPDRPATMARLAEAIAGTNRTQSIAALLFLDLDGFKKVNDSFGHARGDEVLRTIAHHLRRALRTEEFLGRIGGDEFAVVLSSVAGSDEAAQLAERLCAAVHEAAAEQQLGEMVSLSVGIALFPAHARTGEEWLAHADAAMYRAKRSRSGFCTYDSDWTDDLCVSPPARLNVGAADVEREFLLCFQPIFHAATARIHGAEAFVRWLHPQAGMLSPAQFVAPNRWRGISKLDAWVLREALRYAIKWRRTYGLERIYVNLAVSSEAAASDVLAMLETMEPFERDMLALELNVPPLHVHEALPAIIDRFAQTGASIGIDEFELKSFSLATLRRLRVDFIKISYDVAASGAPDEKSMEAALSLAKIFNWTAIVTKVDRACETQSAAPSRRGLRARFCVRAAAHGSRFPGLARAQSFRGGAGPAAAGITSGEEAVRIEYGRMHASLQSAVVQLAAGGGDDSQRHIDLAAERIQQALLQVTIPQIRGLEIGVHAEPARLVGGDYIDLFVRGEDALVFGLGDASGKSLAAALNAMMLRYLVRGLVRALGSRALTSIVKHANSVVAEDLSEGAFITFLLGAVDPHSGSLRIVNAGHEPPLILRADSDSVETMDVHEIVLGIDASTKYAEQERTLDAGDIAMCYTDGLTEASNETGEQFTIERLKDALLKKRALPAAELAKAMFETVKEHAGQPLRDDATILVLRRTPL